MFHPLVLFLAKRINMQENLKTGYEQPATRVAVKELIGHAEDIFDIFGSKTFNKEYATEPNQEIMSLILLHALRSCIDNPENDPASIELNKLAGERLNPIYINYRDLDKRTVKSFELHCAGGQTVAELLTADSQITRPMSAYEADVILKRLSYPIRMYKLGRSDFFNTGVLPQKITSSFLRWFNAERQNM